MTYLFNKIVEFLAPVGLTPETFVIFLSIALSVIALAIDFRIALIVYFMLNVVFVILFNLWGIPITLLYLTLGLGLVLMALTLYTSKTGGQMIQ